MYTLGREAKKKESASLHGRFAAVGTNERHVMVAPRKIYDFSDPESGSTAPPAPHSAARAAKRSDFFIDGWDAYDRWLDDVRDRMDAGDDTPA